MDKQATDKILNTLKNGEYHTLQEITQKTASKEPNARLIIEFLQKFQFIQIDKNQKIKLSTLTKQFLDKLDEAGSAPFYEEITA
jgi:hypothetical protein